MNKIAITLIITLATVCPFFCSRAEAQPTYAMITYYWPGENGGRYDCDGDRLHKGIAAVDFNIFPKGSHLNLGDCFHVLAKDCGGRAVISRKAARENGLHCPVIDVWATSEREANRMQENFPSVVKVTFDDREPSSQHLVKKVSFPIGHFFCYNPKIIHDHAIISDRFASDRMLASD